MYYMENEIPHCVRNDSWLMIPREKREKQRRALLAFAFPFSLTNTRCSCHSERSEESLRTNTFVIGNVVRNLPLHH